MEHSLSDYDYNLCLVFDVGDRDKDITITSHHGLSKITKNEFNHFEELREKTINCLEEAHLKFTLFKSKDKKNVFCFLTADEKRFKAEAQRIKYDLILDHDKAFSLGKEMNIKLAAHTENDDVSHIGMDVWQNLYGPFLCNNAKCQNREDLYKKYQQDSIFRQTDRIKLLSIILKAPKQVRGCQFKIQHLIEDSKHPLSAFYPLHEQEKIRQLEKQMASFDSLIVMPLGSIRDYFGEQIAFYFAFLQFYSKVLLIPASFGTFVFVWQLISGKTNVIGVPILGLIVAFWSTIFVEKWKQHESILRGKWGMATFTAKEQPRPGFTGVSRPSAIDGQADKFFSQKRKMIRMLSSYAIIFYLIALVISLVVSIVFFRIYLVHSHKVTPEHSIYLASFLNAIGIQSMNFLYGRLAFRLNSWENHKTDTDYENGIIAKTFLFKAVNSYYSLFYMAFLQKYDPINPCPKGDPNCMGLLRTQLGIIFVTHIFFTNLTKVLTPWIKAKMYSRKHKELKMATDTEKDFHLKIEYENTIDDFDGITIHHGYATLFIMALPITPLFALLGKIMENKLDSYMLLFEYRRPLPRGACNIGTWRAVFEVIGYLNVCTNVALITIVGDTKFAFLQNSSLLFQVLIFILLEHVLFLVKFVIQFFIPDISMEETMRVQRQNYLVQILLHHIPLELNGDENNDSISIENPKEKMVFKYGFKQLPDEFNPAPVHYEYFSESKIDTGMIELNS